MNEQSTEKQIPELGGKTWSELECIDADDGHRLVRDVIREKIPGADGTREAPVMVRIPRPLDIIKARAEARLEFAKQKGLDPDRDADMFTELEQLVLLARSIRTIDKPHAQFAPWDELASRYDEGSLGELVTRLEAYRHAADPRVAISTEEEVWQTIFAIARSQSLVPLGVLPSHSQARCILTMAFHSTLSPTGQSCAASCDSSTPE